MGVISEKLRASAKGQPCTFQIPGVCNGNPETTVLCHIGDEDKGLGNKGNDWSSGFGCDACHATIDQHKLPAEDELFYCLRALQRTWKIWIRMGYIVVSGIDISKPKTRPGRKMKSSGRSIPSRPFPKQHRPVRREKE